MHAAEAVPVGTAITSATFHFEITQARDQGGVKPSLDVYQFNTSNPDAIGISIC